MLEYHTGDVTKVDAELLINASNGKGWMGGLVGRWIKLHGVAESIHYVDHTVEKEAKKYCKANAPRVGEVFQTESGKLGFPKGILHAVTMKNRGLLSSEEAVRDCINKIADYCIKNSIKTVSIPLLGAGTGRVEPNVVLELYKKVLDGHPTTFKVVTFGRSN